MTTVRLNLENDSFCCNAVSTEHPFKIDGTKIGIRRTISFPKWVDMELVTDVE